MAADPHVLLEPIQQTLDLGVPLAEVDFCVVDLETTGGSPVDAAITEIGAVRYRGGELLGTFDTLVDPRMPIPPFVAHLTGIDDRMVRGAPPIEAVLPSFEEFSRGCVIVAHNARFDVSFLNAALVREDREPLPEPAVCTARLARRVVWPDVPNVRLATLAAYFRTDTQPSHRALADARATAEVLHGLIDLGGRLGITTLGDLYEAVRARGRPNFGKIRLADELPRGPGVYVFRGRDGAPLYVGKSTNVRARVKTYFYGDPRRKIADLLDKTASVEAIPCESEIGALVLEARLIREHAPRFNRRGTRWRSYAYLKLDLGEAYPRLKVVREPGRRGVVMGPFASATRATLAKEAIEDVFALRRCTTPMAKGTRFTPCALGEIGRCVAPCAEHVDRAAYRAVVDAVTAAFASPGDLLSRLEDRMRALALAGRYEEAAGTRDRLRALAEAIARSRQDAWITGADFEVVDRAGAAVRFSGGTVAGGEPIELPCARERLDELAAVRSWLSQGRPVPLGETDGVPLAEPVDGGAALHRLLRQMRDADDAEEGGRR